jgi:hypothetical protein
MSLCELNRRARSGPTATRAVREIRESLDDSAEHPTEAT